MPPYVYCATSASVATAVAILKSSPRLIVDTEGKKIGREHGLLSIITVGSTNAASIFLFDVVALSHPDELQKGGIRPLLELFRSQAYTKLMWDGRCDYLEIAETYRCETTNILDLQVVELVSRWEICGEGEKERNRRLQKGYFGYAEVRKNSERYIGMHVVSGLQRCIEENGLGQGKDVEVKKLYKKHGSEIWMTRPLATVLLDYAATDIQLIADVYALFRKKGWLSAQRLPSLLRKSQSYVRSMAQAGRHIEDNIVSQHASVILEGVLEDESNKPIRCTGCQMALPLVCFASRRSKKGREMRHTHCGCCVAIAVKKEVNRASWNNWVPK